MDFGYPSGNFPMPIFDKFSIDLCNACKNIHRYLIDLSKTVLEINLSLQIFIYVYGAGGTGKSTFASILTVLVGEQSTHLTTLKALNSDLHEVINLMQKRMVLISDTDGYLLKMML